MPRLFLNLFSATSVVLAIFSWLVGGIFSLSVSAAPNYFGRVWQSESGLPQNSVSSVLQTRDGYIWVGTYSGLARFDGARFTIFDNSNTPEMSSSRVKNLAEADDGALWIGHERGEVTCYRNGRFDAVSVNPKWSGRKTCGITIDETGAVWLADSQGLLMAVKTGIELDPVQGTSRGLVNLARGLDGKTWISRDGTVSLLYGGKLTPLEFGSQTNVGVVQGVCPGEDNQLWIAINGLVAKWDGKNLLDSQPAPWKFNYLTALVESKSGFLAAGTDNDGLYFFSRGHETIHFTRTNGLPSDWVESICEDREGNLWVGTSGGLVMLRATCLSTVSPPDAWQARPVLSVDTSHDDSLWIGTEGAGLYHLANNTWSRFGQEAGLGNSYIWSISEDAQSRIWVGTWGGGLFVQNGARFERSPGINYGVNIPALLHDDRGAFWIGTGTGLLRYDAGQPVWVAKREELGVADVRVVVKDRAGAIWFGMLGGGLGCYRDGKIQRFRKRDGLSSDFVQCLHFDNEGALWIGTFGGGLNRLKNGRFASFNKNQGLPDEVICDIESDDHGFFWISSHGGIIRINQAELNQCLDGLVREVRCQSYGTGDGLPTTECTGGLQPAGSKTADGRLWFPTSRGLVVVNPQNVKTNLILPPVVVEKLLVDEKVAFENTKESAVRILPGRHRIEFQYTALSFTDADKVRFKYRLNGWETAWVDAQKKRVADYNYIPPGKYDFQVIACNNDGIWNETGAKINLAILPYFWQTLWFRIVAAFSILGLGGTIVWYDTRRRMRFKLERVERRHALENERSRIAHDIHDDLGATLTRITMISEPMQGSPRDSQAAETDFKQIYDTARELTRAMDEIVWAVNPKHDTLESLVNYLQKFAQDFLHAAGIRCELEVPFQIPAWLVTAETRHNLFLAFKEALNNVVKHASASEVRIWMSLTEPRTFELSVVDNGCGFDCNSRASDQQESRDRYASGNGLENMTSRLAKIGGSCRVTSLSAKGTTILFGLKLKTD